MEAKHKILKTIRQRDEPALSASTIAERTDISVKTVNKHLSTLVEEDRVQSTQIGNAQAYYVQYEDLPDFDKADHLCVKCGREVYTTYDFARIDVTRYYREPQPDEGIPDFKILCRFCQTDLIKWIEGDRLEAEYPFVHSWDLPNDQLEEVRNDSTVESSPGLPEFDAENWQKLILHLEENYDKDEWLSASEAAESVDFLNNREFRKALNHLFDVGYLDGNRTEFRLAK